MVVAFVPVARALVAFRGGTRTGFLKGAYHLRKAWKSFSLAQTLANGCDEIDAGTRALLAFGVGAFQFAISIVPPSLAWLVELVGFGRADRAVAVERLHEARSGLLAREATLVLVATKMFFFDEKPEARELLAELRAANPTSPLLLSLSGTLARNDGRVDEALAFYAAARAMPFDAPQLHATIAYHVGSCHFMLNQWPACIDELSAFLARTSGRVFRPYAAFRLGVALHFGERHDEIAPLFKRALAWVRPNESFDEFARVRMERVLEAGGGRFAPLDALLDAADGLHEAHHDKEALRLLDAQVVPLLRHSSERDAYCRFYHLKGACLRRVAQPERAEKFLRSALAERQRTVQQPHYAVPYSLCELGELFAEQGREDEARQAWTEAQAHSGFLWAKLLANRVAANLEKQKRRMKKSVK